MKSETTVHSWKNGCLHTQGLVHKSGKQEIETGHMCSHVDAILVSCGLPVNLHPLPDLSYQALDSEQKNETADTIGQKKRLDIG